MHSSRSTSSTATLRVLLDEVRGGSFLRGFSTTTRRVQVSLEKVFPLLKTVASSRWMMHDDDIQMYAITVVLAYLCTYQLRRGKENESMPAKTKTSSRRTTNNTTAKLHPQQGHITRGPSAELRVAVSTTKRTTKTKTSSHV